MAKADVLHTIEVPKSFTDVLYLTNRGQVPAEIKRLLKQKGLSVTVLPIDKFADVRDRLDLIRTVIIDAEDPDMAQQQSLARMIESLEMENIGVILLTNRIEIPIKSFSLRLRGAASQWQVQCSPFLSTTCGLESASIWHIVRKAPETLV